MNPIAKPSRSKIGFADLYLERYGSGLVEGLPQPDPDLFMIVTIPAYKETELAGSILSLLSCDPPGVQWEIIININYPENAGSEVVEISKKSLEDARQLSQDSDRTDVKIHCLWSPDVPERHAGVGLARKLAMDQAIHRFNFIGKPEGVILSFDADSACEKSYLKEISDLYRRNPKVRTANICFHHPLSGGFDSRIYHSIAQYELYLRYMRLAIEQTGHPHSIHTVGSSFSVRSKTYIRVNGMGRDKAGEDFYFLHKCIQQKNFWEINDTEVWPSVRESDRVSFGTGASVHRLQSEETLEVFNLDSFGPLHDFFGFAGDFWQFKADGRPIELIVEDISPGLSGFLKSQNAKQRIEAMHSDSASRETFNDKFFAWFNGFMILKYLNEVHKTHYMKAPVLKEATRLALVLGIQPAESAELLLMNFRTFEKSRGNRKVI